MTEPFTSHAMYQAPTSWKITAYLLLVPAIGLTVYGISRVIIGTILIAFPAGITLYPTVCLPVIFFLIPALTFFLPFSILRDATEMKVRNLMIGGIVTLILIVLITFLAPTLASILWGF